MIRLFVFLAVLLTSRTTMFSQIVNKGTILVGGNAGFQFKVNNKHESEYVFSVAPYALYSVIKQFALGGQIAYSFNQYKNTDSQLPTPINRKTNSFSIGPAVRTNIFIGGKTYFFFHASPSFGIDLKRYYLDRAKPYDSNSIIAWRLGPGFSIFTVKNIAVELGIYYDGMKEVLAIKQEKSVLLKSDPVFTHGLTVAVGLQFYAHKKQKQLEPVNSGK